MAAPTDTASLPSIAYEIISGLVLFLVSLVTGFQQYLLKSKADRAEVAEAEKNVHRRIDDLKTTVEQKASKDAVDAVAESVAEIREDIRGIRRSLETLAGSARSITS